MTPHLSTAEHKIPAGLTHDQDLVLRIEKLNAIGIALSSEKDMPRLLEMILVGAKLITRADGGTLYTVNDDKKLC